MGAAEAFVAVIVLPLMILAVGIWHPGFQVIYPPHQADAIFYYDSGGKLHTAPGSAQPWIFKMPWEKDSDYGFYLRPYKYDLTVMSSDGYPMIATVEYFGKREQTLKQLHAVASKRGDVHWQQVDAHALDRQIMDHAISTKAYTLDHDGMSSDGLDWCVMFDYLERADKADAWAREEAATVAQYSPWENSYDETYQRSREYYRNKWGLNDPTPEPTPYEYTGPMDDTGAAESQEDVNEVIEAVLAGKEKELAAKKQAELRS